jgi:flagellin
MSLVVNTNVAAITAANHLNGTRGAMEQAMERLASGKRINGAADDAAGLAISSRMTSQIQGLNQSIRNANDAISLAQTAEGALVEIENMLQRMRELAVQAETATNTADDREYMDLEFEQLKTEIDRIAQSTQFNGQDLFTTGTGTTSFDFAIGYNSLSSDTLTLEMSGISSFVGGTTDATFNSRTDIHADPTKGYASDSAGAVQFASGQLTQAEFDADATFGASGSGFTFELNDISVVGDAITAIDNELDVIRSERADLGSKINRLNYTIDNMSSIVVNTEAARSRIVDADFASESAALSRAQVLQQAGSAMLAQANAAPQAVLSLLQ